MSGRRARPIVVYAALLASAVAAVTAEREIAVAPGEQLTVELEVGGSITVSGWERPALAVTASEMGHDVELAIERIASGAVVHVKRSAGRSASRAVDLTIRVPRRFDLQLETTGGSMTVEDVEGQIVGLTHGGELRLSGLRGRLDMTTHGGAILVEDSAVDGSVTTHGGNVVLRAVRGAIDVSSLGGNVTFEDSRPDTAATCRPVRISTLGGDVRAPDAPCGIDVETLGGNVRIDHAGGHVDAKTLGGNIVLGAVDGRVTATTAGGDIRVTMVGDVAIGRRDVRLDSASGEIVLSLPAGISAEFDVTLAYTRNSAQNYRIMSDFPLEVRASPAWDYAQGTPRKFLVGRGSVDGGRNKIKIEAVNGDVRIVRVETAR